MLWAADINYLPMARGFPYLVSWRFSNTLDAGFCVDALQEALSQGRPEAFNTDQGSHFTSGEFSHVLQDRGGEGQHALEGAVNRQHLREAVVAHREI